ncbi:MAG TPA: AMP-binding protein [Ramlibacter sp.]|uniref:AMP-binding protein n=1 Tax=Ramlibacter sp. TaxID=1917967 RepID=UPI002D7FDF23|nr:AMP-binding protein [Ramlibacter sp.]HET8748873.1 AMP-binding protein [Ramlibacter sp.]
MRPLALPALEGPGLIWSRFELDAAVSDLAATLITRGTRVLATWMDNGPAWVVADLAAHAAGIVHVPLPVFFTPQQVAHVLQAAGVDTLLADPAGTAVLPQVPQQACRVAGRPLALVGLAGRPVPMPPSTSKITFTSGTTGAPKGVCLDDRAMQAAAAGLVAALEPLAIRSHLCVLPLAVLLENLAGVLAPLAHGATVVVPPLAEVGLTGSSAFEAAQFHHALLRYRPNSVILLPQMLRAWTGWLRHHGMSAPGCLKIVAVGGAAVGAPLVQAARERGIPAFEGYGLSEGASVQTLNLPGADRAGSVGRPLPHARLRVAPDGEIEVTGTLMAGYLGDGAAPPAWWSTGDLGRIDADGFVYVEGRKRNVLITGFGRNVSPEWVETALRSQEVLLQAVVFGDGQPALSAVVWPLSATLPDAEIDAAVQAANAGLPDYARVGRWVRARAAFDARSGLATANGRPQRAAILSLHADALGIAPAAPQKGNHALLP